MFGLFRICCTSSPAFARLPSLIRSLIKSRSSVPVSPAVDAPATDHQIELLPVSCNLMLLCKRTKHSHGLCRLQVFDALLIGSAESEHGLFFLVANLHRIGYLSDILSTLAC